jgi:hypothetical protein
MFGYQFYPTPPALALEMVLKANIQDGMHVCDPEAGKGDLLIAAKKEANITTYYCEIDPQLALLTDAVADNFIMDDCLRLTASDLNVIDVILMNPPFKVARKHILHIWDIMPKGATLVALRNSSNANVRNKEEGQLAALISNYGSSEKKGSCFLDSQRKTSVEVDMIYLQKPANEKTSYDGFEDYFSKDEEELASEANGIMRHNEIFDIVSRYVSAVKAYGELYDQAEIVNSYASRFSSIRLSVILAEGDKLSSINAYKIELQRSAWQSIFATMDMKKYLTNKLKQEIDSFVTSQTEIPFTMTNIYLMIDMVIQTQGQRMDRVAEELFDRLTKHYDENRWNVEGWKTNDSYLVGMKFIFPYLCEMSYKGNLTDKYTSSETNTMHDLVLFLDYLTGYIVPPITEEEQKRNPYRKEGRPWNVLHEWFRGDDRQSGVWYNFYDYFEAKGFKKGTMHFRWKDKDQWARFNQHICKIKGFVLPEVIKKKK